MKKMKSRGVCVCVCVVERKNDYASITFCGLEKDPPFPPQSISKQSKSRKGQVILFLKEEKKEKDVEKKEKKKRTKKKKPRERGEKKRAVGDKVLCSSIFAFHSYIEAHGEKHQPFAVLAHEEKPVLGPMKA